MRNKKSCLVSLKLIQQKVRIWVLLRALREAVIKIQKITNFQAHPPRLPSKGDGGKNLVQDQRTHMPIKNFPMSEFPKEKSGLPPSKGTAETSFIEGERPETPTQENILSEEDKEKELEKAEKDRKEIWPNAKTKVPWGKKKKTKGVPIFLGKNKGEMPVYTGEAINPNIDQTKYIREQLGPKRTELIQQKAQEIEALDKTIREGTRVADDENEQPSVRERAYERITENTERRN